MPKTLFGRLVLLGLCLLLAAAAWSLRISEKVVAGEAFCVPFSQDDEPFWAPMAHLAIAGSWHPHDYVAFQIDPERLPAEVEFVASQWHGKRIPLKGNVGAAQPPTTADALAQRLLEPDSRATLIIARDADTDLVRTYREAGSLEETPPDWHAWKMPGHLPLVAESLASAGELLASCRQQDCVRELRQGALAVSYTLAAENLSRLEQIDAAILDIVSGWRCDT